MLHAFTILLENNEVPFVKEIIKSFGGHLICEKKTAQY